MPTFNPPLARETTIPVASSDRDRFVHLRFTLTFDAGESAAGSWELWTDIADVHTLGQEGAWGAVRFHEEQEQPNEMVIGVQQDGPSADDHLFTLPSTPVPSPSPPGTLTLVAEMVVPAHHATYAYTHRHETESGETHWLGNGGDNGVVRIIEGDAIAAPAEPKEWTGIAVEMPKDGSAPQVHEIPNDRKTHASVLLLKSTPPAVRPLFYIADAAQANTGEPTSSLVITSNQLRPIAIEAKATNAVASGIKYLVDDKRNLAELLQEACNGQTMIQPAFGVLADQAAIFLYCPAERPSTAYLVIYAPNLKETRTFKPLLPTLQSDKSPLALRTTDTSEHSFIPADQIRQTLIGLSAGKTARIVEISQFIDLPTKTGSSIWVAGQDALALELREEPIPSDPAEQDEEEILDQSEPSVEMSKSVSSVSHSDSDVSASSATDSETSVRRKVEPSTFLHFLRRFVFSIWSWIFAPFGFGQKQSRSASVTNINEESAASTPGAQTPTENTPLLGSPEVTPANSSTVVSPYVTPKMAKSLSAASSAPGSHGQQTAIRTYASLTFARAPIHLLFEPGVASKVLSELKIRYRQQPDGPWAVSKAIAPAFVEGHCDEVVFGEKTNDAEARWEVEIESI